MKSAEKEWIHELWNNEYPVDIKLNGIQDFEGYIQTLINPHHTLVRDKDDVLAAWFVCFVRDNEDWFAMIVDSRYKGMGIGTTLLDMAKSKYNRLNGWAVDHDKYLKQDGSRYRSPLRFYIKNEFKIVGEQPLNIDNITVRKIVWSNLP